MIDVAGWAFPKGSGLRWGRSDVLPAGKRPSPAVADFRHDLKPPHFHGLTSRMNVHDAGEFKWVWRILSAPFAGVRRD
jgi:hypothetical protein